MSILSAELVHCVMKSSVTWERGEVCSFLTPSLVWRVKGVGFAPLFNAKLKLLTQLEQVSPNWRFAFTQKLDCRFLCIPRRRQIEAFHHRSYFKGMIWPLFLPADYTGQVLPSLLLIFVWEGKKKLKQMFHRRWIRRCWEFLCSSVAFYPRFTASCVGRNPKKHKSGQANPKANTHFCYL